jgi:type I restriction enzyme S subunit
MSKVKLGDVAELITKGTTPTTVGGKFTESGINFVKSESIADSKYLNADIFERIDVETDNKLKRSRLEKDDLLFSIAGAYLGKVAIVRDSDVPANTNQAVGIVRLKHDIVDKDYAYYFYTQKHITAYINNLSSQSSQPNLNLDLLGRLQFELKALEDQRQIAAVLSALDAKIDCNNRINAELEAMAKTLYDYWFVQFNFPDANGNPYKSSGGKMVYNSPLKREIPAGWRHSTIGETFKTYLGGTPSREKEEYWTPSEVNWLSSGENPSTFVVDPDERISNLGLQNSPAKLLPPGTVILSIVRHLRASILAIEAATNQSVVGIVESGAFKHCFIYPYVVREIPRLMVLRTGAQQPHINKGVLDESLLVVPDDSTLEAYTSLAAPLFLQIKNFHQQNRELTRLRDWLLPLLMNGQVTVM